VSIIVPCWKQAGFVGATVKSVRAQQLERWELIVAVDGSPDGSAVAATAAAGGDPRVRVSEFEHTGVCRTRNRGLAATTGVSPYVLFLDADDVLEPTMLERMVQWLDAHPDVPAAHCASTLIDADGRIIGDQRDLTPRFVRDGLRVRELTDDETRTPFESLLGLAGVVPSMVIARRSAIETVGGFDETFGQGFEDTDLLLRLALLAPLGYIPEPLIRYRVHAEGSSLVPGRHQRQEKKLHAQWRETVSRPTSDALTIERAWRFHDRQLTMHLGCKAAASRFRAGKPLEGLRFIGGAARSWLVSVVRQVAPL
jgi:glycosyltransferase involved in cell wall biosynthesis